MLRAVIDTNTIISGNLRPGKASAHLKLILTGLLGGFHWIITDDILLEYIEKLLELGVDSKKVQRFTEQLLL